MSKLEATLALHIRAHKLPEPEREYRFHPKRRWRMDFAWPDLKLAAEVEGGIHSGGRHVRGKGYEGDLEKYNAAVLLGWDVVRFSGGMVTSGQAVETIRTLIALKGGGDGKQEARACDANGQNAPRRGGVVSGADDSGADRGQPRSTAAGRGD